MTDGGASFSLQRRLQPAFCVSSSRYRTAMRKHADGREP
jgi:hypothetical protein